MSIPAVAVADLCPRCHNPSLFVVREQVSALKSVEAEGKIVRVETQKPVEVRVCSDASCGYRSDDA